MVGRERKGQITILLVLVLILLLVFGLMFFIKGGLVKDILSGAKGALGAAEGKTKLTESVEACVQHATQEGLILVGRQGGAIYNTQVEGTADFIPAASNGELTLPVDDYDVSYAIREESLNGPPEYPIEGPLGSISVKGYIGKSTIIPLCDANGPNAWDVVGAGHTCISYDPLDNQLDNPPRISPHSIQDYLRAYILNKSLECMNLSEWASEYDVDILPQGDATLEVIIGDSDVTAQLTYPLQVGGSAVSSFVYQSGVRLKKVYELANGLAEWDNRDLTLFVDDESSVNGLHVCPSVDRNNSNENCSKPGMSVEVIDAPCISCTANKFADIVRITDENSLIVGEPYVFQFARENRRPALDPLDETDISGAYDTYLRVKHGKETNPFRTSPKSPYSDLYNLIVTAGDEIELIPYGLDPDEDELTYHYTGWLTGTSLTTHRHQKEHCNGGDDNSQCNGPFERNPVDAGGGSLNKWEQAANDAWRTHKTRYKTKPSDAGYKLLRIEVCDTANLCDYQDLGILVNDRPEFTLDVPADCCTNCQLTIDSDDKYYANYSIEIVDTAGNVCVNEIKKSLDSVTVTYAPPDGRCRSVFNEERVLTVRVTDDFGASYNRTFTTACHSF